MAEGPSRPREPTRITNLRKRLQRIEHTKQKLREGNQVDRRQLAAIESEQEVREEIEQWEKLGVLQPRPIEQPPKPTLRPLAEPPPQPEPSLPVSQQATKSEPSDVASDMVWPPGGAVFIAPCPPPGSPVDAATAYALAHPSQKMEKEPTRVVNLRRRLQRILHTKERLNNPANSLDPAPDNRQLQAMAAESEIVWEIQQWEAHRLIYPLKPEQRYIPPGSTKEGQEPAKNDEQFAEAATENKPDPTVTNRRQVEMWALAVTQARIEEKKRKTEILKAKRSMSPKSMDLRASLLTKNLMMLQTEESERRDSTDSMISVLSVDPVPNFTAPQRESDLDSVVEALPTTPLRVPGGVEISSPVASPGFTHRQRYLDYVQQTAPESPGTRIRKRGGSLLDRKYYNLEEEEDNSVFSDVLRRRIRSLSLGSESSSGEPVQDFARWLRQVKRQVDEQRRGSEDQMNASFVSSADDRFATQSVAESTGEGPIPLPALRQQSTHFLENSWTIWFDETAKKGLDRSAYEDCVIELGCFNTVQSFWMYWNNLRVEYLKENCNLRLFKTGVKPTWEDPHNAEGGRWVARNMPRDRRAKYWCDIVMAMIGELIEDNSVDSVMGVVLSTKDTGDTIQLWTDGGHIFRTKPELFHQGTEEYRKSRPSMSEVLHKLFDGSPDVVFTFQSQKPKENKAGGTHQPAQQPHPGPGSPPAAAAGRAQGPSSGGRGESRGRRGLAVGGPGRMGRHGGEHGGVTRVKGVPFTALGSTPAFGGLGRGRELQQYFAGQESSLFSLNGTEQ